VVDGMGHDIPAAVAGDAVLEDEQPATKTQRTTTAPAIRSRRTCTARVVCCPMVLPLVSVAGRICCRG